MAIPIYPPRELLGVSAPRYVSATHMPAYQRSTYRLCTNSPRLDISARSISRYIGDSCLGVYSSACLDLDDIYISAYLAIYRTRRVTQPIYTYLTQPNCAGTSTQPASYRSPRAASYRSPWAASYRSPWAASYRSSWTTSYRFRLDHLPSLTFTIPSLWALRLERLSLASLGW